MDCSGICRKLFGAVCGLALVAAIAGRASASEVPVASASLQQLLDQQCPAGDAMLQANDSDYGRKLIRLIRRRAFNPGLALNLKQSGVVQLCIEVSRDGQILQVRMQNSSGYFMLDGAALYSAGRAKTYGVYALPDELGGAAANVWFTVPVEFSIAGQPGASAPPVHAIDEPKPDCELGGKHPASSDSWQYSPEGQQYLVRIKKAFEDEMAYPPDAESQSEEGHVMVCMVLNRQGQLLNARLSRSSGDPLFDGVMLMAVGMVEAKAHIGPVPAAVSGTDNYFMFSFPVDWEMRQR